MEAVAKLNNSKGSARKGRLVADLIRGKEVYKALSILKYARKGCAPELEKLVTSAISNWESKNEGYKAEDSGLFIKKITVDEGPTMKRFQPAPFGRAYRIRKRTKHVTIVVDSKVVVDEVVNEAGATA